MNIGLWRLPKRTKAGAEYPSFAVIYHKKHNRCRVPRDGGDWLEASRLELLAYWYWPAF